MSNKQHQSLWVTHWVKRTCLCRTCNTVGSATTREFLFSWFSLKPWDKCDKLFILLVPSLLFCPPIQSHSCCSSRLHRSTHLQGLFNTKTTHIPKIAPPSPTCLIGTRAPKKRGEGGESQPSSVWKIVSAGCLQRLLFQCWPSKGLRLVSLVPIKHCSRDPTSYLVLQWKERDRQTDYIACLWVIIQPCLITYAPSSLSLPFLALSSWWRGLRPSLHFW